MFPRDDLGELGESGFISYYSNAIKGKFGYCPDLCQFLLDHVIYHFGLCFVSYARPFSAHAGHIQTDRSLLTGHNALLLQLIARIFYMYL